MSYLDTAERVYERTVPGDPVQQRIITLLEERRRIDAELRDLKQQARTGHCERCGTEFIRRRITKRYCSQRCTILSSPANSTSYHLDSIVQHIDLLDASGLMTPRSIEILRVLVDKRRTHQVAGLVGVSHQRVSQIAAKATKAIKMILLVAAALRPTEPAP